MWKIACDSSQLSLLVTLAEARAALEAAAELALVACALCMLHPHIRLFTKHRDRGSNNSCFKRSSLCTLIFFCNALGTTTITFKNKYKNAHKKNALFSGITNVNL